MSSVSNKFDAIINHIIDIKEEQARQGEKIDQNTNDLKDHIEGVKQNRIRIEVLEKDRERTRGVFKFIAVSSGAAAGIVAVVSAVYNYFM